MRMKKLLTAALTGAMAVGLFALPASAGGGATVFVAHGIPGVKVDVCVNGAEARSNFKYGRAFELGTGIPATDALLTDAGMAGGEAQALRASWAVIKKRFGGGA